MKKKYEAPKLEKLEFNYVDAVTASDSPPPPPGPSNSGCRWESYCVARYSPWCGCGKHWRYVPAC